MEHRAIVGVSKRKTVEDSVRAAVSGAGGLDFVGRGATVLVKPNVNSDDPSPATTGPAVVSAVVAMLREQGAGRVIVGDRSVYWGDTIEYMKATGIYDAARLAGAGIIDLETAGWTKVRPRGATGWTGRLSVSKLAREADYIVSVPVIKSHKRRTTRSRRSGAWWRRPASRSGRISSSWTAPARRAAGHRAAHRRPAGHGRKDQSILRRHAPRGTLRPAYLEAMKMAS